jgi:hypothetical protein
MKKKVLVYDNEVGYYNLLVNSIKEGFEFTLYSGQGSGAGFDVIMFFLHDKIEALDIARLYDASKPFILAADNSHAGIRHDSNMYVLNLSLPQDDIMDMLNSIFNELLHEVPELKK